MMLSTYLCSRRLAWSPPDGTNDMVWACAIAWCGTRDTAVQNRSKTWQGEGLIIIMIVFQIVGEGGGEERLAPFHFLAFEFFAEIDQLVARISPTINLVKARHYKWVACSTVALEGKKNAWNEVADIYLGYKKGHYNVMKYLQAKLLRLKDAYVETYSLINTWLLGWLVNVMHVYIHMVSITDKSLIVNSNS